MLKYNIKILFRNIARHKGYSFINIAGLAIGLAGFILIFVLVRHELSYDTFHENIDNLYRLSENMSRSGQWQKIAMTSAPIGPAMVLEFPEVVNAARFMPWQDGILNYNGNKFSESIQFADPSVFEIFSFPLVNGDPKTVLVDKFTIALSESAAKKYFGEENPIGKFLNYEQKFALKVSGVFKDIPANSHLQFDVLVSLSTFTDPSVVGEGFLQDWSPHNFYTYLLLQSGVEPEVLEVKIPNFIEKYMGKKAPSTYQPFLESYSSIYLHSKTLFGTGISGDINFVRLFIAIAILILLMAAVNFINLTTARSGKRAKEVGVRKVCGCQRFVLMRQFLSEAVFLASISLIPAIVLVEAFLPGFNSVLQKNLSINYSHDPFFLVSLILITVLVGLISGVYPAFFLSSFEPVHVLKSQKITSLRKIFFGNALVIFQFVITIVLIIGTMVVYKQVHFMKNKDLGFYRENVLYMPLKTQNLKQGVEVFKNAMLSNSNIISASASSRIMGNVYGGWFVKTPVMKDNLEMTALFVNYDFVNTLGLKVIAGRNFSKEMGTDKTAAFLLNKQAVAKLGLLEPIDQPLEFSGNIKGKVIGVLEDFNFESLHTQTEPLIVTLMPSQNWNRYLAVKIRAGDVQGTIRFLEEVWNKFETEQSFEYYFLDERLDRLYKNEERFGRLISYFAFLAVIVGCLGLFGLSAYSTEQRTKEIGIRKVLGASVSGIVSLLSKDFVKLVLLANLIAWPIAWYAMNKWLQNFAYRIDIGWWVFILAGVSALVIALLTVSTQAIKAATANPVDSLKYE